MIEQVSADSLRKTGIFAEKAGDFSAISTSSLAKRESRDEGECAKSRHFRPNFTFPEVTGQPSEWVAGDAVLIAPVSTQIPC